MQHEFQNTPGTLNVSSRGIIIHWKIIPVIHTDYENGRFVGSDDEQSSTNKNPKVSLSRSEKVSTIPRTSLIWKKQS